MAKIGIITAMKNEFDAVTKIIKRKRKIKEQLFQGYFKEDKVFIGCSGIGKVNASIMATEIAIKHKVDFLIIAGVGGAVSKKINLFDVVVSDRTSHFDFDLEAFGHKPGQIPNEPEKYIAYDFKNIRNKKNVKVGEIISADHFITKQDVKKIESKFPNALSVDMETVAIGQVAHKFGIPFLGIRVICDFIFKQDNKDSYNENVWDAIEKLQTTMHDVLEIL